MPGTIPSPAVTAGAAGLEIAHRIHRSYSRRGNDPDGHRSCSSLFRCSAGRSHTGSLLHPLDHPLLRAGVYLSGGNECLFLRPQARLTLSRHLLIRGVWLIFLELTFLRVAWTFNFDFKQYEMAGVIWVIGCCMILMAGLVKLPVAGIERSAW